MHLLGVAQDECGHLFRAKRGVIVVAEHLYAPRTRVRMAQIHLVAGESKGTRWLTIRTDAVTRRHAGEHTAPWPSSSSSKTYGYRCATKDATFDVHEWRADRVRSEGCERGQPREAFPHRRRIDMRAKQNLGKNELLCRQLSQQILCFVSIDTLILE